MGLALDDTGFIVMVEYPVTLLLVLVRWVLLVHHDLV